MLTTVSSSGHDQTVTRLLGAISQKGLVVFAQIDHAAAAREAGMDLPDEVVILFGNPSAGTPLMQADPRVGIELPLRVLVFNEGGQTIVGYNDPTGLAGAYDLTGQASALNAMSSLLQALASEAAGSAQRI